MPAPKGTMRCSAIGCDIIAAAQSPYDGKWYCWRHLQLNERILA